MKGADVFKKALEQGVYLCVENGKLIYKATKALPDDLKAELIEHKQAVVDHLLKVQQQSTSRKQELPDIRKSERDSYLPLSYSQQRLWFIDQLNDGSAEYNLPSAFRVTGAFEQDCFIAAIHQVIERHEVLRSVFLEKNGKPFQQIRENPELSINECDFSMLEPKTQQEKLQQLISDDAQVPFRLNKDVMLRVGLVKLSKDEHVILFNMHHIVSDAWSLGILIRELSEIYVSMGNNAESPLEPLKYQYYDYAKWQHDWLRGDLVAEQIQYWKQKLDGAPPLHNLPLAKSRPERQTFTAGLHVTYLPECLTQKILELCNQYDVTLFIFLQTVFALLLGRYSNDEDIVVGTPVAGRMHKDLEPLIGFFVNVLVLRTDLTGNPKFNELLQQNKINILDAYSNQYVSFDMLVEELKPVRTLSHSPIFQIMMVMQQKGNTELPLGDLKLRLIEKSNVRTPYDIELGVLEGKQLQLSWKYSDALFDQASIAAIADNFSVLLENTCENPNSPILSLAMISTKEKRKLDQWQAGPASSVPDKPLHNLIAAQLQADPERIFVNCSRGSLTGRQLDERSNQLSHCLIEHGVKCGGLVALCLNRSIDLITAILAVHKAGAAYLPLDPNHPAQRLNYTLEDSGAKFLLTQMSFSPRFNNEDLKAFYIDGHKFKADLDHYERTQPKGILDAIKSDSLAYVIYTSGSTGKPKGVMVEHGQLANFHHAMLQIIDTDVSDPVWLAITNYCFDISILELLSSLAMGFSLVIADDQHIQASSVKHINANDNNASLADLMSQYHVTHFQSTPSLLAMFIENAPFVEGLADLKQLLVGGEALPLQLAEKLCRVSKAKINNMYGPTETTIWSTSSEIKAGQNSVAIGSPVLNTQVYVLDQNKQQLPVGVDGELYIGGGSVTRGYLNRENLSADKYIEIEQLGRIYKTGDKVRWRTDGQLAYIERYDYQVKLRGFRIELGEIENALLSMEAVRESIVLHCQVGADEQLVAYLVPVESALPEGDERQIEIRKIKNDLLLSLPDYMVPSIYIFLPELPLTPNGKVNRNALPAPDDDDMMSKTYLAPRNELEQRLCEIWQQLLKVDRVGVEDNFFDLGGHSLLSTQLISQIRDSLDVEMSISALFENPTIASFSAAILEQQMQAVLPPIEPVKDHKNLPLSYAQQRLWVIDRLEGQSAQYNMPYGFTLKGGINQAVIERTLITIIERHESLRTRFYEVEGEVCQHVDETFDFKLVRRDLSDLDYDIQRAEIKRISIEDEKTPFDLSRDLMLRAQLLILSDSENVLLFNMHHIVSDGWSMRVLVMEFYQIYTAYLNGKACPLVPLPLQYGDYSNWQRSWLKDDVLDEQVQYWKNALAGLPKVHQVPLDKLRPKKQTFNGDSVAGLVDIADLNLIKILCQQYGITLFMYLQTAFSVLLSRYSQQSDIVMSTVVAGRGHKDVESMIGFFLNTIVLRTEVDSKSTFKQLLLENKKNVIGAYAHQHVSFDTLVEELNPPRSPRYNPMFQVMVSLLDEQNEGMTLSQTDLQLEIVKRKKNTAKFELVLNFIETSKGLKIGFVYNSDLFYHRTIENMVENLIGLLRDTSSAPQSTIEELSIVTPEIEGRLRKYASQNLSEANKEIGSFYSGYLQNLSEQMTGRALTSGDESYSYTEMEQNINAWIKLFKGKTCADEPVLLVLETSPSLIFIVLALIKCRRKPIILMPNQPEEVVRYALTASKTNTIVCQSIGAMSFNPSEGPHVIELDEPLITEFLADNKQANEVVNWPNVIDVTQPILSAYVLSARGFIQHFSMSARDITESIPIRGKATEQALSVPAVYCPKGFFVMVAEILSGKSVVLSTQEDYNDCNILLERVKKHGVKELTLTNLQLHEILENGMVSQLSGVSAIYIEQYGLPTSLLSQACKAMPWVELLVFSYSNAALKISRRYQIELNTENVMYRPHNVSCLVANELGRLQAEDCYGELIVTSNSLDLENGNPTGLHARYRYGGNLEISGLIDEQLTTCEGIFNATQLQRAMLEFPSIADVVISGSDEDLNGGRLLCYTIMCPGKSLPESARSVIDSFAQNNGLKLSAHILDKLSFDLNGEIDFAQLPDFEQAISSQECSVKALTPTQKELVEIWEKLFSGKSIGINDNFFEIGGHSLLMILLIKKISETFEVDIPMATFMESSTIEELSYLIEYALAQKASSSSEAASADEVIEEFEL